LIRDELTAWITAMDQYKTKGRGSDRQFYLAAWGGEPVAVHRKVQDVSHPFVSVCGCLPPDLLNWLHGEGPIADGFLDRLLFSYPESTSAVGETWIAITKGKNGRNPFALIRPGANRGNASRWRWQKT
jgi:hypothetical protein